MFFFNQTFTYVQFYIHNKIMQFLRYLRYLNKSQIFTI